MIFLLIAIGAACALFVRAKGSTQTSSLPSIAQGTEDIGSSNSMLLPDIDPLQQQGGFDESHDTAFVSARDKNSVPFALLKAHAIRESALKADAIRIEPTGKASYGLMQILWWPGSSRFKDWGYSDDEIGDGSLLYDEFVNCDIASRIILDNWNTCSGNLRDTINMYNTGAKEAKRAAPNNYVNDVLSNYSKIVGRTVS